MTATSFKRLYANGDLTSFSRRGNCYDNATMSVLMVPLGRALYNPLWSKKDQPSFKEQRELLAGTLIFITMTGRVLFLVTKHRRNIWKITFEKQMVGNL